VCTVHYCSTLIVQAGMRVVKPVTEFDLVCIESLKGFCVWDYKSIHIEYVVFFYFC